MEQRDQSIQAYALHVGSRDGNAFPEHDRGAVLDTTASSFSGFTRMGAEGYYRGRSVAALVFKTSTENHTAADALVRRFGSQHDQHSVGIETGGYFRSLPLD